MKKRALTILIAASASAFLVSCAQAEDKTVKPPAAPVQAKEKAPRKELTKEELASHLKGILDHEPDVLDFIPGLKRTQSGNEVFYTFQGVKLEELDKEKLNILFSKIQGEMARIRAERLSKQLESINQAQRASMIAQQAARNAQSSVPQQQPAIIQPPQIPQAPPQLPQIPKPPPAPPTPPRR